jgi:cell division protein FtsZ
MSIGEFEEVGNTIKEFASDDATVVIGTVIEPEMQDELRVTIVATGLGLEKQRKQPYKVVKTGTGTTDYEDLETPTVIRNRRTERPVGVANEAAIEYLDIPAFLRKQAD